MIKDEHMHSDDISRSMEDDVSLFSIYRMLKNYKRLIIGLTCFFFFSALGFSMAINDVYRVSSLVRMPHVLAVGLPGFSESGELLISGYETKELVDALNRHLEGGQHGILGKELGLDIEAVMAIVSIKIEHLKEQPTLARLTIEAYDTQQAVLVGEKIVGYLNRNDFVRNRIALTESRLNILTSNLEHRLERSEEVKKIATDEPRRNGIKIITFNPTDIETQLADIRYKLATVRSGNEISIDYAVIFTPTVSKDPIRPKRLGMVALGGLTGLASAIFMAFFLEWLRIQRKRAV